MNIASEFLNEEYKQALIEKYGENIFDVNIEEEEFYKSYSDLVEWLQNEYGEEYRLLGWQKDVVKLFIQNRPRASGKSFLIKLLTRYDKENNW